MSRRGRRPAYGGTPYGRKRRAPDRGAKARGLEVVLYPFVMMDVPAGNALPDPATGAAGQPPYPWRGRITAIRRPARRPSDGTSAAATQVEPLVPARRCGLSAAWFSTTRISPRRPAASMASSSAGSCRPDPRPLGARHLSGRGEAAGARGRRAGHPAARHEDRLRRRLDGVRRPCSRRRQRGALSPRPALFAIAGIDAVGIDCYPPLSDWREGSAHLDLGGRRAASTTSITCAGALAAARPSTGTTRRGRARRADPPRRSPTEPMASRGCSARRISSPGGRTGIWSA